MMRSDEGGTEAMVVRLGEAVGVEVGSAAVGREVAAKVDAICDRAWSRERFLDAVDSLGYHVRLILDNEEGTYCEVREMVRDHLAACDPCPLCGGSNTAGPGAVGQNTECPHCGPAGTVKRHPHQLGDRLREYVEGLAGLEGVERAGDDGVVRAAVGGICALDSMTVEILSTALAWVDWGRVAAIYLSEVDRSCDACGEFA